MVISKQMMITAEKWRRLFGEEVKVCESNGRSQERRIWVRFFCNLMHRPCFRKGPNVWLRKLQLRFN